MAQDRLPKYVQDALVVLSDAGATPYVVGGAVRDTLLGKQPKDYDIASALRPEEVIEALSKNGISVVDKLGQNFGVVVGVFDGEPVEIATFRADVYKQTGEHKPESVIFCNRLEDDLSRRDFTMNAMALDAKGNIIDPYRGKEDVENGIIRPVGNAEQRYREDPLRMYRACRFVAQTGFMYVEQETGRQESSCIVYKNFWKDCKASNLSMERVRQEMEKLLVAPYPDKGLALFMNSGLASCPCMIRGEGQQKEVTPFIALQHLDGLEQNQQYHRYDAWGHTMAAVKAAPADMWLRYTMLFHDAGKGTEGIRTYDEKGLPHDIRHERVSAIEAEKALNMLGYSRKDVTHVKMLVQHHMDFLRLTHEWDMRRTKRYVRSLAGNFSNQAGLVRGLEELESVFVADLTASRNDLQSINNLSWNMAYAKQFAKEHMPIHSKDLDIPGAYVRDMAQAAGIPVKDMFTGLIQRVQAENLENTREKLVRAVQKTVDKAQGIVKCGGRE